MSMRQNFDRSSRAASTHKQSRTWFSAQSIRICADILFRTTRVCAAGCGRMSRKPVNFLHNFREFYYVAIDGSWVFFFSILTLFKGDYLIFQYFDIIDLFM